MKRFLAIALGCSWLLTASGAELRAPKDIDFSELSRETQKASYTGGTHIGWWVPTEFWRASLERDGTLDKAARERVIRILDNYSLLAVVQAEISPTGVFNFYDRDTVTHGLKIEVVSGADRRVLSPLEKTPDELAPLMDTLVPIIRNALGQLGQSMYFFVLADEADGKRVISPYQNGELRISLRRRDGSAVEPFVIEFPLDSLYVPRICPNGKPAHISWTVCPWDGSKLPL